MKFRLLAAVFAVSFSAQAETVKDREGAVRSDKAKMEDNERWIYNDVAAGFAEAEKTGKPLMVVLRCVPCLACMGIDTEVLTENAEITPLMDKFVRVRLINANSIDLSLFQFDYDLSFSVLFFNADRTIYGRYGSWEHQTDSQNRATNTFRQALEGALELHQSFPANRNMLEGKTGAPSAYKTPVDMPAFKEDFQAELDWKGQVVKSCVHCHQVGDAVRRELRDAGEMLPLKWILPYPKPETIGVSLEEDPVTQIASIESDSVSAGAGLKAGDRLVALGGQPLISVADFSWVLHNAPDAGSLEVGILRDGEEGTLRMNLPEGWRLGSDISRRVGTWPMRAMAFGGMKMEAMEPVAAEENGIAPGKLALLLTHVGKYGKHAMAKKAGFRKGDIILAIDGSDDPLNESQLITLHLTEQKPGATVPVTVLRNGKRIDLAIPIQ